MKTNNPGDQVLHAFNSQVIHFDLKNDNHVVIDIAKEHLPSITRYIRDLGGRLFTMVGSDELNIRGDFSLYYVFAFDKDQSLITVRVSVSEQEPGFPSVTDDLPSANWYEREVYDLFGLEPVGHPHLSPLVLHGDWPEGIYPMRKDFPANMKLPRMKNRDQFMNYEGEGVTQIPVGPIHAGIIEPGHFRFGAVGDTVLHLDARLFYTHRGLEKVSEGVSINKALFLAERICGVCALSHAVSFAQAIERIGKIKVPARAEYLRMLFLEMERLYNHIGDVGNVCAGIGFSFGVSQGAILKEKLMQLNEKLTGHRYLRGITTIGGVRLEFNHDDKILMEKTLGDVRREFEKFVGIMMSHEIVSDRMTSTGRLTREQVEEIGTVGPAARASGRNIDVRKSHPYLLYDQIDFSVPVLTTGDVLARVQQRIEETYQSFAIIGQILNQLPEGPIQTRVGEIPAYQWDMGWTESARGENVHWVMTGPDQTVYRYRVRSAAYSNWPAVALAVPGNIVPDFPLINKSFELCYACCDR